MKVRGQTGQASEWRRNLEADVTRTIREAKLAAREEIQWKELASIQNKSALKVLREEPKREEGEPWRKGNLEVRKKLWKL